MVRSIDPRRVTLRQFQWPSQAAAVLGTHTAETIFASGHVRPHRKAGHMEASDPIKFSVQQPLQEGALHIWNWKSTGLKLEPLSHSITAWNLAAIRTDRAYG